MRCTLCTALLVCLSVTCLGAAADQPLVVDVWPGKVPGDVGITGEETIRVVAETPPLFLVHASDDRISEVDHSVTMYLAMKRAGVPAELHVYASGGHGFGVRTVDHPCATWTERCGDWLRNQGFLMPIPRQ